LPTTKSGIWWFISKDEEVIRRYRGEARGARVINH